MLGIVTDILYGAVVAVVPGDATILRMMTFQLVIRKSIYTNIKKNVMIYHIVGLSLCLFEFGTLNESILGNRC